MIPNLKNTLNSTKSIHTPNSINIPISILCPLTKNSIKSSYCYKCKYCQINKGSHISGRFFVSLICLYGLESRSEK